MDLRNAILEEHSKEQTDKIARWIGCNEQRFGQLLQLFLHDEYRVVQRAAWALRTVADKYPQLLMPHLDAVIARLNEAGIPVAVKRNVVAVLQQVVIPEPLHGEVMNACFAFLENPKETIAVKAHAMTILANLAKVYPDIKNEIAIILHDLLEHEPSAGIRSRAQKVLKQLDKI